MNNNMRKKQFIIIALLCAVAQVAWAQTWVEVGTKEALNNAIADGAHIRLTADITLSAYLKIGRNASNEAVEQTVTIDLNGKTLSRSGLTKADANGHVIEVFGKGNLTLTSGVAGGTITGGWANNGGGICNFGAVTIGDNVTITGCRASEGGGIKNYAGATLTISGGTISGNISDGAGGGIYNAETGSSDPVGKFTMTGGTISGNTSSSNGGGVCNYGDFTLTGGTITNNHASAGNASGGGIYHNGSTFTVSGNPIVTGNTGHTTGSDRTENAYLSADKVITIGGEITTGCNIGLCRTDGYNINAYTEGLGANSPSLSGPVTCFTEDIDPTNYLFVASSELFRCPVGYGNESVSAEYLADNGAPQAHPACIKMSSLADNSGVTLYPGWYVVDPQNDQNEITFNNRISVVGEVHLILKDNTKLIPKQGIRVPQGSTFHIHAQSTADNMGALTVRRDNMTGNMAGIGGNYNESGGNIHIHGGTVTANGKGTGAGIGGGGGYDGGIFNSIIISGGEIGAYGDVDAESECGGAGIGGGACNVAPDITITGGAIIAIGGADAAGIGSGCGGLNHLPDQYNFMPGSSAPNRTIYITGGNIMAQGTRGGAGIGGGRNIDNGAVRGFPYDGNAGNILIDGGVISAFAFGEFYQNESNQAIGHGAMKSNGDIVGGQTRIYPEAKVSVSVYSEVGQYSILGKDERLHAIGDIHYFYKQVIIKPCDHPGATYTVNGTGADGTHTLQCNHCQGGTAEQHTFDNETCTVCGVHGNISTVSVYMPVNNNGTYGYGSTPRWTVQLVTGSSFELPAPKAEYVPAGVTFAGWRVGSPTELGLTDPRAAENESGLLPAGESYTVNGNASLTARFTNLDISLADNADNTVLLGQNSGKTAYSVTLSGRTLYKDGNWNTLCLPFDVTIAGSPLDGDGVDVRTLSEASFDSSTGELTLNFTPASGEGAVTTIEAGKPYIIKWNNTGGTLSESDLKFNGKTISDARHDVVITLDATEGQEKSIAFRGIFSPLTIGTGGDNTKLYLGTGNQLYYPNGEMSIGACRAYFQLNGLTASDPNATVRAFVLNFGDDSETTGILSTTNYTNFTNSDNSWYSLDGRKLAKKPTAKGVYIHHGKKTVIQ